MLFREVFALYSGNQKELVSTLCEQNKEMFIVKAGARYS
jgi:hypothetical protein